MAEPGSLSFPDGPRVELDQAIASLVAQSERVMRAQGRLRALLRATEAVMEHSDLPLVLRSIVEAATELVGAQYGALGVISPEGDTLDQFVHVGLTNREAAAIGHLPEGHGLLGALITDSRPIRLPQIADDARAVGFPAAHPPMKAFLGVPIRVRDEVFGNLYLTNHPDGEFSEEDEELVSALAGTAGSAIENARLLTETATRARWMTAAAELSAATIVTPPDNALDLLTSRVRDVSNAAQVTVLLPHPLDGQLRVAAVSGDAESALRGKTIDPTVAFAARTLDDGEAHSQRRQYAEGLDPALLSRDGVTGPVMTVPLRSRLSFWGVLCIAREPDADRFSPAEIEAATDLASRASIALELARANEEAKRALLADDRRRIARDLHDHVIQQIFGAGLALQSLVGRIGPGADSDSVLSTIDQLDDAIAQIRTVVFALSHRDDESVRHRLLDVVGELSAGARRPLAIRFTGPVDLVVREDLAPDIVAVTRELLSNAIRHAHADHISLEVAVDHGSVAVIVEDDGIGIHGDARRSGLDNVHQRATLRHGRFEVESSARGTTVRWSAPTSDAPAGHVASQDLA